MPLFVLIYLKLLNILTVCKLAYIVPVLLEKPKYVMAYLWGTVITLHVGHHDH